MTVLVPTFLGITILSFMFIRLLPGDPVLLLAGERGVDEARYAELMTKLGYDRPIYIQYFDYLGGVLQGDLGESIVSKKSVLDEFLVLFPATMELSVFAMFLAVIIGIPAGTIAAVKKGSIFDYGVTTLSLTGYSMPIFWWGLLLILFFSGFLGITPVSGRISFLYFIKPVTGFLLIDTLLEGNFKAFLSALHHLILPSVTLATIPLAVITRQTRSAMLETLNQDYIRTAYAKGLSKGRIIFIHGLRNALITVITVIGLQVGVLLAGAILTETIYSWPGVGKWVVDSISRRDYTSVQGGLLLIALIVMFVNLTVDLSYALVNPRIRK